MKVNNINLINYKAQSQTIAPRSQQQQNRVNFEKEKTLSQKADSVKSNPITALGYKLYRTFRILSEHDNSPVKQTNLNTVG